KRIELGETWRNEFTNPIFGAAYGEVIVQENVLPHPRPSVSTGRFAATDTEGIDSGPDYRVIRFLADVSGAVTFYRTSVSNGFTDLEPGDVFSGRVKVGNPNTFPVTMRAGFIRRTNSQATLESSRTGDVTIPG